MELFGDTVLKLLSSIDLFLRYPGHNQEALTIHRASMVSNHFLSKVACHSSLTQYVRAAMLSLGHGRVLLSPPGMYDGSAQSELSQLVFSTSLRNVNIQKPSTLQSISNVSVGANQCTAISLVPKVLADVVEALIGALYTHSQSLPIVMLFLQQLGIVHSGFDEILSDLLPNVMDSINVDFQPLLADWQVSQLQEILGYTFQYPVLLNMAVIRMPTSMTHNYERLELLGNAVLDFLVVSDLTLNTTCILTLLEMSLRTCSYWNNRSYLFGMLDKMYLNYLFILIASLLCQQFSIINIDRKIMYEMKYGFESICSKLFKQG
ncbi:hypothetical protein EON65_13170 [archaeon]|nr:MAG: hypothetical protein EON65_13170 [archaeon]